MSKKGGKVTTAQRESLLKTKKNQQQLSCPVAYDVADIGVTVISTFPARLMKCLPVYNQRHYISNN